jgi:hypothetical protein
LLAKPAENKGGQVGHVSVGGRGNDGGVAKAARELGKPRTTIRRDLKIATITPPAEAAAIDAGLGDNQTALLRVAASPSERQVETAAAIVQERIDPPPRALPPQLPILMGAWSLATADEREKFREHIQES